MGVSVRRLRHLRGVLLTARRVRSILLLFPVGQGGNEAEATASALPMKTAWFLGDL
jgi:hypothetical protein